MSATNIESIKPHVVIATCGYESRSSFIAREIIDEDVPIIVIDYQCSDTLSYNINRAFYDEHSKVTIPTSAKNFNQSLRSSVLKAISNLEGGETPRILVDVSSCSRSVMAAILVSVSELGIGLVNIFCGYALSRFDAAPVGELPLNVSEPVIGELSGWSDDLSKPPCAIISLGFEPGRALGSIDYLEVPEVRLFMPSGPDERFEQSVKSANLLLINEAGADYLLPYDVMQPNSTYAKLESLVSGLLSDYRPVIIPLGPKIFAAISMVLAIKMFPKVCVWRTSAGSGEDASDKIASGEVSIFSTTFETSLK